MLFGQTRLINQSRNGHDGTTAKPMEETKMPYFFGWLLGVPVIVLIVLYLLFH
jgi:hypothetical protein